MIGDLGTSPIQQAISWIPDILSVQIQNKVVKTNQQVKMHAKWTDKVPWLQQLQETQ